MIDCVVAPVDQRLSVADEEVRTTEPPAQNVVEPLAEIVGVGATVPTVTIVVAETKGGQAPMVVVTK